MHIFSGVVSQAVSCGMFGVSGVTEIKSIRSIRKEKGEKLKVQLPKICAASALVFAAQMLDFEILGTNTSGHIVGGLLLALLFGADIGYFALSILLALQCLLFGDGGIMELGCNIWNMAFYGCYIGSMLVKALSGNKKSGLRKYMATVIGCVISLELGAITTVAEFAVSGSLNGSIGSSIIRLFPLYMAIGLIEGSVTYGTVRIYEVMEEKGRTELLILLSSISSIVFAGGLSLLASAKMDGIDRIAGAAQYHYGAGMVNIISKISLFPDYQITSVQNTYLSRGTAGILGIMLTAGITYLIFKAAELRKPNGKTLAR